jgi:hypothetical protein
MPCRGPAGPIGLRRRSSDPQEGWFGDDIELAFFDAYAGPTAFILLQMGTMVQHICLSAVFEIVSALKIEHNISQ